MTWKHVTSPTPKKFKVTPSADKEGYGDSNWDSQGVIMTNYLSKGSTVTDAYYANELRELCEALKSKQREKPRRGVLLLHNNAPAHTAGVATSVAAECTTTNCCLIHPIRQM